eukprot:403341315
MSASQICLNDFIGLNKQSVGIGTQIEDDINHSKEMQSVKLLKKSQDQKVKLLKAFKNVYESSIMRQNSQQISNKFGNQLNNNSLHIDMMSNSNGDRDLGQNENWKKPKQQQKFKLLKIKVDPSKLQQQQDQLTIENLKIFELFKTVTFRPRRGLTKEAAIQPNKLQILKAQQQQQDRDLKEVVEQNLLISQQHIIKRSEALIKKQTPQGSYDLNSDLSPCFSFSSKDQQKIPQIKINIKPKLEISIIDHTYLSLQQNDSREEQQQHIKRKDTSSSGFQTPLGPKLQGQQMNASEKIINFLPIGLNYNPNQSQIYANEDSSTTNQSLILEAINNRKQVKITEQKLSYSNSKRLFQNRKRSTIIERRRFSNI